MCKCNCHSCRKDIEIRLVYPWVSYLGQDSIWPEHQYFLGKAGAKTRIRMVFLFGLTFLFPSIWAFARASDCDSFMYGTLCPTDHLSNIIWTIPDLENEIKCQVINLVCTLIPNIHIRLSVLRRRGASISCLWNSRQELLTASFSDPVRQTPRLLAPTNQIARWLCRDLWPRLWWIPAVRSSKMFSVILSTRSDTSLRFLESRHVNNCAEMNFHAPTGRSLEMSASFTVIVEHQRYDLISHRYSFWNCFWILTYLRCLQSCSSCTSGPAFPDMSTCASHQVITRESDVLYGSHFKSLGAFRSLQGLSDSLWVSWNPVRPFRLF